MRNTESWCIASRHATAELRATAVVYTWIKELASGATSTVECVGSHGGGSLSRRPNGRSHGGLTTEGVCRCYLAGVLL